MLASAAMYRIASAANTFACCVWLWSCGGEPPPPVGGAAGNAATTGAPLPQPPGEKASDHPDLKFTTLKEGSGEELKYGMKGKFHYTGMLVGGKVFDSSRFVAGDTTAPGVGAGGAGEPREFQLIDGGLIKGWVLGLQGMKVGERRRLYVPAHLGYGSAGRPPEIPGDAALVFDVELVSLSK